MIIPFPQLSDILFKSHRWLYRFFSPLLRGLYELNSDLSLGKTLIIGLPILRGKVSIESGVLVSLPFGNPLGVSQPCRLIALEGEICIKKGFGGSGTTIISAKRIDIGSNVMIGTNVLILDSDMHPTDYLQRRNQDQPTSQPIKIGDDVWIGSNCIILKGVEIGDRSVIGAGSTVRKSVPPDSVYYN